MESGKLIARAMLGIEQEFHVKRLGKLANLEHDDIARLRRASTLGRVVNGGKEIASEGGPVILVSGWACRISVLPDGRRQVFGHLIPGDVFERGPKMRRRGTTIIVAQLPTTVIEGEVCSDGDGTSSIARACRLAIRSEGHYAQLQVLRLGRLTAVERMIHFFLELGERLETIGAGSFARFPLPISQEILADTLGLTKVHVNRTLQSLRSEGILSWKGGYADLVDPTRLASIVFFDRLRQETDTAGPLHCSRSGAPLEALSY